MPSHQTNGTRNHLSDYFTRSNRSIVVHVASAGAPRYSCANITKHREIKLESDAMWKGNDVDGTVTGAITITQASEFSRSLVGLCILFKFGYS